MAAVTGREDAPTMDAPLDEAARQRIRAAAVTFVDSSVGKLEVARAMPLFGRESPWLDESRIWNVLGFDYGEGLAKVLEAELPTRFRQYAPTPRAHDYAIALLRAVIADATIKGVYPSNAWPSTLELVDDMLRQVETPDQTIRCIRLVTDIDVSPVAGAVVSGVRLRPVRGLPETLSTELKEAAAAVDRIHVPRGSREPRALLVADHAGVQDTWLLARGVRPRLQYLATALRLLTGATIAQTMEVYGQPSMVHASEPIAVELDGDSGLHHRRVGTVDEGDLVGISSIVEILKGLDARPPKTLPSLVVAIGRYNRSYRPAGWQDLVIDLSIGIEAALSTGATEDLSLALRSRAAHLLATLDDPADEIFKDVGELYEFRSRVVHGSVVPESDWTKLFARKGLDKVVLPVDRLATAMDRWRDLVRRAILARLLLSEVGGGKGAPWPLMGSQSSIDGHLVSPAGRHAWRLLMRETADRLGIARGCGRAEPLRDFLHDPWGADLSN